jgi:hypothetical protein
LIADSIFQKARIQLEKEEYLAGLWNLRSSWKMYESIIEREISKEGKFEKLNQELILNLKYSVGLFYYQISILPKSHQLLNLISYLSGFESDYNLGIKYMFEVFHGEGLKKNQAAYFLLEIYLERPIGLKSEKKQLEEIKPIMEYCLKKFKNSTTTKYYYSIYLKKIGKFSQSKQILSSLMNHIEFELKLTVPSKWIWSLANLHLSLGEWKLAITQLEKLTSYSFFSTIQLVCACQMLGDRKTAIKVLKNFKAKKGRYGNIVLSSLESLESRQFSVPLYSVTLEILYFRDYLKYIPAKKLEIIKKQLDQLVNTNSTNEKKKEDISILTLQSIILKYLLKLKESKVLLKKIVELNDQSQEYLHWTVCHFYFKNGKGCSSL